MCSGDQIAAKVLPVVLAGVKHGTHWSAFYETKDDLIDLVLPFFTDGLKRGDMRRSQFRDHPIGEEGLRNGDLGHLEGDIAPVADNLARSSRT